MSNAPQTVEASNVKSGQSVEALLLPRGKKKGKDSVPVSVNYANWMEITAQQEADLLKNTAQSRIQLWLSMFKGVSETGAKPDVLKAYPDILKRELAKRFGFWTGTAILPRKGMDEQAKRQFQSSVAVPASVASRVVANVLANWEGTIARLAGPGTVDEKLKSLTFSIKKKEASTSTAAPLPGTGEGAAHQTSSNVTIDKTAKNVSAADAIKVLEMVLYPDLEKCVHFLGIHFQKMPVGYGGLSEAEVKQYHGLGESLMQALARFDKEEQAAPVQASKKGNKRKAA